MRETPRKEVIEGDGLNKLLSPYWAGGYRADTHVIESVTIEGKTAVGRCRMAEYFSSPTDPNFHLSIFNATTYICQIGITHALRLNGFEAKTVEVLMTDYSMTLARAVKDPNDISVRMTLFGKSVAGLGTTSPERRKSPRSFYRWKVSVSDDAFWGVVGLCFPF